MIEELLPHLYRIEIPLPKNPLRSLNSYLIEAEGRFLLIDTGMNREACRRAIFSGLEKLNVDLNITDFFITHLHADHSGLVGELATETSRVYFSEVEAALANSLKKRGEARFQELYANFQCHGFPKDELDKALDHHPGFRFRSNLHHDISVLREGDELNTGNYSFRCIERLVRIS